MIDPHGVISYAESELSRSIRTGIVFFCILFVVSNVEVLVIIFSFGVPVYPGMRRYHEDLHRHR